MLKKSKITYIEFGSTKKRVQNFQSAGVRLTLGAEVNEEEDSKEAFKELKKLVNGIVDHELDRQLKEIDKIN